MTGLPRGGLGATVSQLDDLSRASARLAPDYLVTYVSLLPHPLLPHQVAVTVKPWSTEIGKRECSRAEVDRVRNDEACFKSKCRYSLHRGRIIQPCIFPDR